MNFLEKIRQLFRSGQRVVVVHDRKELESKRPLRVGDLVVAPFGLIDNPGGAKIITYGFQEGVDLEGSDLKRRGDKTSFKVNYKGNSVPVRVEGDLNDEDLDKLLSIILKKVSRGENLIQATRGL